MKRYLTKIPTILFAALLLASCSGSDATEQAGGSAAASVVSFTVTTDDAATRGIIPNTTAFTTNGRKFRVWAFMNDGTGEVAMFSDNNSHPLQNVDVTYVSYKNVWSTDETYYWPRPRYTVDFYAVFPTTVAFNGTSKSIDYSSAPVGGDDDVMFATYQGKRDGTEERYVPKEVPLGFHHALSFVDFEVKSTQANWKVYANKITLHNLYKYGTMELSTGNWTMSAQTLANNTQEFTMTSNKSASLMLIPQTRPQWNPYYTLAQNDAMADAASLGCYLAIECAIYDGTKSIMGECDATGATSYQTLYTPIDPDWTRGKGYHYVFDFKQASNTTNLYTAEGYPAYQTLDIHVTEINIEDWTPQTVVEDVKVE